MPSLSGEGGTQPLSVAGLPRTLIQSSLPAPCRLCGGPAWKRDEEGSVHPCCELTWAEGRCRGCEVSRAEAKKPRRPMRPVPPRQIYYPPYEVGDCSTCHRTSVRFYLPYRCYYCVNELHRDLVSGTLSPTGGNSPTNQEKSHGR